MSPKVNKISVLMAVFNGAKYLKQSIKSILEQTYYDFEFIIIDDASTDSTGDIVKAFNDPRIIYQKLPANKGTAGALNYGLNIAKGDWIARIDSDDINTPDRLEKQKNYIEQNPGYDVISSWSIYFKDTDKILFLLREPVEYNEIYDYLNLHNPLNQSAVFYRKNIILNEKYNENYRVNEDFELFFRIRDKVRFYNIPEFLVYTRIHDNSKTQTLSHNNIYDVLFNYAFKNLVASNSSKGRSFYWATRIAWINFFYGNRKASRNYFINSFSLKNIAAYFSTFLPDKYFYKMLNLNIKYRAKGIFTNKKKYRDKLRSLIK